MNGLRTVLAWLGRLHRREAPRFAECLDRALADAPPAVGLRTLERALAVDPDGPVTATFEHEVGP